MAYSFIILRYVSALVYKCIGIALKQNPWMYRGIYPQKPVPGSPDKHKDTEEIDTINDSTVGYWQILWSIYAHVGIWALYIFSTSLALGTIADLQWLLSPKNNFPLKSAQNSPHIKVHLQLRNSVLHVKLHSVRRIAWPWYEEEQTRATVNYIGITEWRLHYIT